MSNNKKGGIFGKGYYIALILCAAAIGISGYMYYRNANKTQTQLQEPVADVAATAAQEDVIVVVTQPAKAGEEAPTVPGTTPTQPKSAMKTCAPVEGQTVSAYAMDCLSYNETTRDWRVHNGVDIAAEEGTPVCAAADGVVEAAYEDDLMGYTVVIRHDGGYVTQYSSLAKELSVKSGEAVHMGQVIGCASGTALVETTLGSHIHFGVTFRDAPMDPAEFLALGS